MPQYGHKKPFSAKQKKKQLQLKREKKKARDDGIYALPFMFHDVIRETRCQDVGSFILFDRLGGSLVEIVTIIKPCPDGESTAS